MKAAFFALCGEGESRRVDVAAGDVAPVRRRHVDATPRGRRVAAAAEKSARIGAAGNRAAAQRDGVDEVCRHDDDGEVALGERASETLVRELASVAPGSESDLAPLSVGLQHRL